MSPELRELAARWDVTLLELLPGATCAQVASGRLADGREVVLKLPEHYAEERRAWPTLLALQDHGGVDVLAWDPGSGAVLMPRLRPGVTLAEANLPDLHALAICAELIQTVRAAEPPESAIPLERMFEELDQCDHELVPHAKEVSARLFATTKARVLLHGDLHHYNILLDGGRWRVIDPKGLLGDPTFEVAAFMRNPIEPHAPTVLAQRIGRFHQLLGDPIDRLWGWSFAQTVLCASDARPPSAGGAWSQTVRALWSLRREFWA